MDKRLKPRESHQAGSQDRGKEVKDIQEEGQRSSSPERGFNVYEEAARQRAEGIRAAYERGEKISDADTIKTLAEKIGGEWNSTHHATNEGSEVSIFSSKNPEDLRSKDKEAHENEIYELAAKLDISPQSLNKLEDATPAYECFGDALANGKGRLQRADAETILKENFRPIDKKQAQEGDVLAYRYDVKKAPTHLQMLESDSQTNKPSYKPDQLLHLSRVSYVDHDDNEILVRSKLGSEGKYEHEPHHLYNAYGGNLQYYRPLSGDGSVNEA